MRVDRFGGGGELGLSPPAVAAVMLTLELSQPGGVHLVAGDAAQEEVIPEQPTGQPRSAHPEV